MRTSETGGERSAAERRLHPREPASNPIRLVTPDGQVIDAVLVDRSLSGMRVRSPDAAARRGELNVLSPASGVVYAARVVWRSPPYAGLQVLGSVDMRAASGPDTARARRLWLEHIAR